MADWEIKKTLGECFITDEKIEIGQEYFAALVETEEGLQRRDFCADCWQSQKPAVYCYWKSRQPNPDEKKNIFIDDEMLMAFFERLAEETEPEKIHFRFVLALILMRKRRLKYEAAKIENNNEIWQLKVSGDKHVVDVINPHLDEAQIQQLSSQLGQILQTEI